MPAILVRTSGGVTHTRLVWSPSMSLCASPGQRPASKRPSKEATTCLRRPTPPAATSQDPLNPSDVSKAANTARGHSSRPSKPSDVIKAARITRGPSIRLPPRNLWLLSGPETLPYLLPPFPLAITHLSPYTHSFMHLRTLETRPKLLLRD